MTLADEKIKPESTRYSLVRFAPSRYMNDDYLASDVSAGIHSFTMPYPVSATTYAGTACTKVASYAGLVSNYQFFHDEAAETLYVKLPSYEAAVVATYYLFYASGSERAMPEDPEDDTTTLRAWRGELAGEPTVVESFRDILDGVFSTSASTIQLLDPDAVFLACLTDNDSFNRKEAVVWISVNGVVQRLYTGKVAGIEVSRGKISVSLEESFATLDQVASFGDSQSDLYYTSSTRTIGPSSEGKPIPFVMGRSQAFFGDSLFISENSGGHAVTPLSLDGQRSGKAVCTSYNPLISGTVNRTWSLCRTGSGGFKTLNFGTVSSATLYGTGNTAYSHYFTYGVLEWGHLVLNATGHNVEVGDTFKWDSSNLGTSNYAIVVKTTSTTIIAAAMAADMSALGGAAGTVVATPVYYSNSGPAVSYYFASNNTWFPLIYGIHFTAATTTLASGNKLLTVILNNNFETSTSSYFGAVGSVDPTKDQIAFRATVATGNASHGTALEAMVTAAGLTATSSTFDAADADLAANVSFTIPAAGESLVGTYRTYCEKVLTSTMGYLKADADGAIEYHLLTGVSAAESRTTSTMLKGSQKCNVKYADITATLRPVNKHYLIDANKTEAVQTSSRALYLHGSSGKQDFQHVLEDVTVVCASTGRARIADIAAVRAERRATYTFGDATETVDGELGDDIEIEADVVLGANDSVEAKLTQITRSADQVSVQFTDLLGL